MLADGDGDHQETECSINTYRMWSYYDVLEAFEMWLQARMLRISKQAWIKWMLMEIIKRQKVHHFGPVHPRWLFTFHSLPMATEYSAGLGTPEGSVCRL